MHEAICFGWIDTTVKRLDDGKYTIRFAKRTDKSKWSDNTLKYGKQLLKEGKMSPLGIQRYKEGLDKPTHDHGIPKDPPIPNDLKKELERLKLEERLFNEVKDRGTCVSEPTAIMLASHDFKNIEELYQAQENFEKLILKFKNSSKYKELLEYHQEYKYSIPEFQFCKIFAMHEWMYRNNEDIYDETQKSVPIAIEKILYDEDKVGQCTALTGLMWAFGAVEGINLTAYSTICHTLTCYNDTQQNIPLENTSKYNFTLMYPPAKSKKIKLPDAIIAATAIVNNLVIITRNEKDFKNIENLEYLNPYKNKIP